MNNAEQQIDAVVARIRGEAYRQGWQDAMTALRKAALQVRYDCPAIEYPNGFAGLPEHWQARTMAVDAAPPCWTPGMTGTFRISR